MGKKLAVHLAVLLVMIFAWHPASAGGSSPEQLMAAANKSMSKAQQFRNDCYRYQAQYAKYMNTDKKRAAALARAANESCTRMKGHQRNATALIESAQRAAEQQGIRGLANRIKGTWQNYRDAFKEEIQRCHAWQIC